MMRQFPRTATKVSYWRHMNDLTRNLNPNEVTMQDIYEGRVIGIYDDVDAEAQEDKECSVLKEVPINEHKIGSIFLGTQRNVADLHWYDNNTLKEMLPAQKSDPDTGLSWGDTSHLSNRKILSRFRSVIPMSLINRLIQSGEANDHVKNYYKRIRKNNISPETFWTADEFDRKGFKVSEVDYIAYCICQNMVNLGDFPTWREASDFCTDVLHLKFTWLFRLYDHWFTYRQTVIFKIAEINSEYIYGPLMHKIFKVIRAFASYKQANATLLRIVRQDDPLSMYLDSPIDHTRNKPQLEFCCYVQAQKRNARDYYDLNLTFFTGHFDEGEGTDMF